MQFSIAVPRNFPRNCVRYSTHISTVASMVIVQTSVIMFRKFNFVMICTRKFAQK